MFVRINGMSIIHAFLLVVRSYCVRNSCIQSLDWTGLDWTTGLPLKLKVQYYNSILVLFVHIC